MIGKSDDNEDDPNELQHFKFKETREECLVKEVVDYSDGKIYKEPLK